VLLISEIVKAIKPENEGCCTASFKVVYWTETCHFMCEFEEKEEEEEGFIQLEANTVN